MTFAEIIDTELANDNKCEISSQEQGLGEGEEVVSCSDSIRYINKPFNFAVVLPVFWKHAHVNEREPEDKGIMTSIGLVRRQAAECLLAFCLENSLARNLKKR